MAWRGRDTAKVKKYSQHLHILLDMDEYEFVKDLNGGIGHHIRKMIDAHRGKYNKDFAEIEKRIAEIEPEYFALKKRRDEILKEKADQEAHNRSKDRQIEDAQKKLLEIFKGHHNRFDLMPSKSYKLYSDFCGGDPSPEAMRTWLENEARKLGLIK